MNVSLIVTEYVTVDNMIQGFPGLRFDSSGAVELLGFYRIIVDKVNVSNFDENRIKEIGPTNSIHVTNNLLKQTFMKEDGNDGQLFAVMDVIIKKEQSHDVRIEMWRYYHENRPFQQPKVNFNFFLFCFVITIIYFFVVFIIPGPSRQETHFEIPAMESIHFFGYEETEN
jgi:hypothetical protein